MNQIFKPLEDLEPSIILAAVDRELKTSEYSDRLAHKNNTPMFAESVYLTPDKTVKAASLSEWVQGLSEIALAAYPDARPMIVSMIVGSLHGLLKELGVDDDPRKSRGSCYLPNSIRYLTQLDANNI